MARSRARPLLAAHPCRFNPSVQSADGFSCLKYRLTGSGEPCISGSSRETQTRTTLGCCGLTRN
jgi:hypothetical protein